MDQRNGRISIRWVGVFVSATASMAFVSASVGQAPCVVPAADTLQPVDVHIGMAFGSSLAADANTLIVGAEDAFGAYAGLTFGAGAVYSFQRQGDAWVEQSTLYALDGFLEDKFGASLFLSGDRLLVGALYGDRAGRTDTGSVYLFERVGDAWIQQSKITGSDTQEYDAFGMGLALRGMVAVIGAPFHNGEGLRGGAVYVYRHDGVRWNEVAKLMPPDPTGNDRFGRSVLILESDIVVGAPRHMGIGNTLTGALYVFRDDGAGFSYHDKLLPIELNGLNRLGAGLAQDGDRFIAVGPSHTVEFADSDDTWQPIDVIPVGGASTNVSGEFLVVGGTIDFYAEALPATTYFLRRTDGGWQLVATLGGGNSGVALAGSDAFGGNARYGYPGANDVGIVRFYDLTWRDCNENDIIDVCDINTGSSRDCNRNGIPDECDIADGTSADCSGDGVPDECDRDCNNNGVPDSCDIVDGTSPDECANGIPDECERDCNGNGIVDWCELADGLGVDCNGNGIPDECDIADGRSLDCNANGIPDECELADGTSHDCNEDLRIDQCLYQHRFVQVSGSHHAWRFGESVDISESWAIFGFPDDSPNGLNAAGSAHVHRDSWFFGSQRLIAADATPSAYFGTSVAVDGGAAVVGAPQAREGAGPHTGAAYVFHWNYDQWTQNAKLIAPDAQAGAYMGYSVALKGLVAVVGAPLHLSKCDHGACTRWGAVYVFTRDPSGWTFQQRLTAWDGSPAALFGFALAFDGDRIVVGAPADQLLPFSQDSVGAAYVFRRDGESWMPDVKLLASDGHPLNSFGTSVSLSGARVLVGAPGTLGTCAPSGSCRSGAAYSYRWDGAQWLEEAKWTDFDPADGDAFGSAVALQGLQALVATRDGILPGETRRAVHAFWRTGGEWRFRARLWPNPPSDRLQSGFGASLAMHGAWALIGSPGADGVTGAGHLYPLTVPSCYCPAEEVRFIDPPAGTVDARQPHPPDDPATGQGVSTFVMSGPDHATRFCWQYCVERFDGSRDSTYSGTIEATGEGVTTLQLTRPSAFGPVPPGSTVRLSYFPQGAEAAVAHYFTHPGDVNADGWANARDILELIDILNGARTPRFGNYSADIDHSGKVGLPDLTRLIDLLNGAGAYDPWFNTQRPPPQWCQ